MATILKSKKWVCEVFSVVTALKNMKLQKRGLFFSFMYVLQHFLIFMGHFWENSFLPCLLLFGLCSFRIFGFFLVAEAGGDDETLFLFFWFTYFQIVFILIAFLLTKNKGRMIFQTKGWPFYRQLDSMSIEGNSATNIISLDFNVKNNRLGTSSVLSK